MPEQNTDAVGYVRSLYDRQPQREWDRMDRHRTEFAVTLRVLDEHLPPYPARVLDCGGGPGRYAIELAGRGHDVTLFDLSPGCLDLAQEKAQMEGASLTAYEQGTATDLSRFSGDAFDAVLLMGPLYHLLEEAERVQALAEVYRVLKPGGVVFAAFITRYAPLRYAAAEEPSLPLEQPDELETILSTGRLPPRGEEGSRFVAHFAHPEEVVPLCRDSGFEVLSVRGVEGVVSQIEEGVNALSGKAWQKWVDINHGLSADPSIHGGAEHLLVVAQKPLWRAVLRKVARQLNQAAVTYTVVGGASIALHSVPILVNDLDIETDANDAYRFQALFTEYVVDPVSLCESDFYRSHLGRLDFAGITIEIIGNLHRKEGEHWVPTFARTQTTIDVDGVPVRVSSLEEETLAYIRRGSLDRAAQCLRHCDQDRLLSLLRGNQAVGVL